jgi:hypothetical protein
LADADRQAIRACKAALLAILRGAAAPELAAGHPGPPREGGRSSGQLPVPPEGTTVYCQDENGRPCTPDAAFIWCWSGGPQWYYARDYPVPAGHLFG